MQEYSRILFVLKVPKVVSSVMCGVKHAVSLKQDEACLQMKKGFLRKDYLLCWWSI